MLTNYFKICSTNYKQLKMKLKFNGFLVLLIVLVAQITFAQERVVSGVVSDNAGMPLPGVSVLVKGTQTGTQTDFDGKFSIKSTPSQVLVFSFLGMKSQEVKASTASVNVKLQDDSQVLEEVVVTALGLTKKKDKDLSSSTTVDAAYIKRSGETGLIQGMSGKTSGLLITKSTGDPGAGAYIQIRGQNTILGSGSPLIILDGVQVSNTSEGSGEDGVVQQSRLNDINPEDVESVTVLKGAAAGAIYGTGAANGVLVIKTKRGSSKGKLSVSFKTSLGVDKIFMEHAKQDKFGQGSYGSFKANAGGSWGDKISDRANGADLVDPAKGYFEAESGNIYPFITQKNSTNVYNQTNRNQVFQDGTTFDNNLTVGFSDNDSKTLLSLSNLKQEGIIRGGSNYDRTTLRLNHEVDLTEKFNIRFSSQYSNVQSQRIQQGSNLAGLYLGYLRTSPDFNNTDYKGTYFTASGVANLNSHRGYRNQVGSAAPVYNNPGWTIYEQDNPNTVDRFVINPEINWKIDKHNTMTVRYGLDYYIDIRETFFPFNSAADRSLGQFFRDEIKEKTNTYNAFLNSNYDISDNFKLNTILGAQFESNNSHGFSGSSKSFTNPFVDELRIFGNADGANELPSSYTQETKKSGIYTVINAEFYNQLFVELSGRYERPSTLNENIFYPGISAGWDFSKAIGSSNIFNFGKLRASYGEVGIEPVPYASSTTFFPGGYTASWGDTLGASVYGNPFTRGATLGNPNLKAERVKEYEIGTDLRFYNNRIIFGATYYDRTTEDAILPIDLPPSTGFSSFFSNAAEISNKGLELDLSYKILNTSDLTWEIKANWSQNKNIVESLGGVKEFTLNGFTGSASSVVEGQPFGVIWGNGFVKKADGTYELDSNGFPMADETSSALGDPNPDWRGGLGSVLNYKGFNLSVFFDTSQGNDIWTGTEGVLKYFGIHPETANESVSPVELHNYYNDVIYPANVPFRGNIADFGAGPVALDQDWYQDLGGGFGANASQFVQDASWTRLREITLGYSFPSKFISKLGINTLDISLTGRNLALWTDIKGFDPETNLTGASKGRGLDYFTNPSTKSYLLTLRLTL